MSIQNSDSTAQPIKFAVVGAGHMGGNHIKKLRDIGPRIGGRVSVIVEPDELRAMSYAREFPEPLRPRIVSNLGMLGKLDKKDFPDAAIVAVPATIHVETTSACLSSGLHCLVEKPLGFSAMDVKELDAQAKKAKRYIQVGLLERWSMCHLWGDWSPKKGPWTINSVRSGPFVPRAADTDVIQDLMIHDLDLFVLLNSKYGFAPITQVRAWGRKLRSQHIDYAIVALDMADGGMARFFASRLSSEASRTWEMTGPDWHASIDFMRRSMKRFERVGRDLNAFQANENHWTGGDPLGLEIESFVRRVRGENHVATSTKDARLSLGDADILIPTPQTVLKCHEIIDEVLSCIKVLGT